MGISAIGGKTVRTLPMREGAATFYDRRGYLLTLHQNINSLWHAVLYFIVHVSLHLLESCALGGCGGPATQEYASDVRNMLQM